MPARDQGEAKLPPAPAYPKSRTPAFQLRFQPQETLVVPLQQSLAHLRHLSRRQASESGSNLPQLLHLSRHLHLHPPPLVRRCTGFHNSSITLVFLLRHVSNSPLDLQCLH